MTVVNSALTNPLSGSLLPSTDNSFDIGSASKRYKNVYATNGTIQTSDRTTKRNIEDSDLGLDFVLKLRPVSFYWSGGDRRHYGLIAQEVGDLTKGQFGGWVKGDLEGLRYTEFISPIIKAIQQLNEKVDSMGVVTREVEIIVEKPVYRVVEVETIIEKPVVKVVDRVESVEKPVYNVSEAVESVEKPVFAVQESLENVVKPLFQVQEDIKIVGQPLVPPQWVQIALIVGVVVDIFVRIAMR